MPDVPVPTSADTQAEIEIPVPRDDVEILASAARMSSAVPEERPPAEASSAPRVPWWFWPLGFLVIFVLDAALVLDLVAQHQNLAIAAGVPGALTVVVLGVLRALSGHMGRRD